MECPKCKNTHLLMSERQGVEIDYCPSCRGVWLDRGELDKILERSAGELQSSVAVQRVDRNPPKPYEGGRQEYPSHPPRHYDEKKYGYKKKSWLSDILDFD